MESYFEQLATLESRDVLLICDRGACDTFAYCSPELKEKVLEKENWTMEFLNYQRYDKIIHMVTAANGAEDYYGNNNVARSENLEEALNLDRKIQEVWFDHPQFQIVDNSGVSFNEKIGSVFDEISQLISLPVQKFVRKFLLNKVFYREQFPKNLVYSAYKEIIIYLPQQEPDEIEFIISRRYETSGRTIHRLKKRSLSVDVEKRVETSRYLTPNVYSEFVKQRDRSKHIIEKDCYVFRMEQKKRVFLYKIETFLGNAKDFSVLHLTSSEFKSKRGFPKFINVVREITEEPQFFTHKISKKGISLDLI